MPTPAVISTVGSPVSSSTTSLTPSPVNLGDVLIYAAAAGTTQVTAVSGGGVTTWSHIGTFQHPSAFDWLDLWMGVVTATGSHAITATGGSGAASLCQEFTAGAGATWAQDGTGSGNSGTSGTTLTFPTKVPADIDRAYLGVAFAATVIKTTGQTSGYTVDTMPSSAIGTAFVFNALVSGSQAPTVVQTTSSSWGTLGALVFATVPSSSSPFIVVRQAVKRAAYF